MTQCSLCFVACCCFACSEFKRVNPRYGPGGYRKSDPVTRYHAFNGQWKSSKFLNKKTNAAATIAPGWKA